MLYVDKGKLNLVVGTPANDLLKEELMALPGFSDIIVSLNQSRLNSDEKSDHSDLSALNAHDITALSSADNDMTTLKGLCKTRWAERVPALKRFLDVEQVIGPNNNRLPAVDTPAFEELMLTRPLAAKQTELIASRKEMAKSLIGSDEAEVQLLQ